MTGTELNAQSLYTPLGQAVEELHRRRRDRALCDAVAEFHRTHPPDFLDGEPHAFFVRPVFSVVSLPSEKSIAGVGLLAGHTPRLNESFAGHIEQVIGFATQRSHYNTHLRVGNFP